MSKKCDRCTEYYKEIRKLEEQLDKDRAKLNAWKAAAVRHIPWPPLEEEWGCDDE